jgi:hypothetical protein
MLQHIILVPCYDIAYLSHMRHGAAAKLAKNIEIIEILNYPRW